MTASHERGDPGAARPEPSAGASEARAADERRLVDGLIAGRHDAISEFLARTHDPVYFICCRLTSDRELRRDWAHEALLGILDDLRRQRFVYRGPGTFWGWFRKRAYYRLLDERRRDRRVKLREVSSDDAGKAPDLADLIGGDDPARELERIEIRAAVEACLARLPSENQRRALSLMLMEELSYQEIANVLESPLNTVRAWIRRARLAMRKCLLKALGEYLDE